ncbi:MAG TPA: hypothetical protein VIJ52_03495, partial [Pseudolabrys sp.]
MSDPSVISPLREKRLELAGLLDGLERQANERRADLAHLDATIRLFDPNDVLVAAQPARRRRYNEWFRPGECRRKIHDVLRDKPEPMTTREIVEKIMAARGLSSDDARARELIHKTVLGSLNRATETIERTQAAGSAAWRV